MAVKVRAIQAAKERGVTIMETENHADNAPMLVINGENDYFVPQSDTRIFEDRPKTEVHLIAEAGHCARSKLRNVMSMVFRWLPEQIGGDHGEGQRCPL